MRNAALDTALGMLVWSLEWQKKICRVCRDFYTCIKNRRKLGRANLQAIYGRFCLSSLYRSAQNIPQVLRYTLL